MGRLADKFALITGASKGLGEAAARLFAAEGATVILADVDREAGERVAGDIGPQARFAALDVRDEQAWRSLAAAIGEEWGRLDILVNNAGVVSVATPEEIEAEQLRFIMGVSLEGTVWGCKHMLPLMRRSSGASIVNMSSITAVQGHPRVAAYTAAKGAVDAYSRCVAVHCAQQGLPIRCNAILPDQIDTPMVRTMTANTQHVNAAIPGNMIGVPTDIAYLLLYLASDESRFLSGQSFVVDNTSSITKGHVPPRAAGRTVEASPPMT